MHLKTCLHNVSHLIKVPAYYLIEKVSLHPVPCLPWSSPNMPCPAWNCHIALWSHQDDVLIGAFTNIDDHVVYYHHELLSVCVTLWSLKWSNCITHWGIVICVNTHRGSIFCLMQILLSQEQLFSCWKGVQLPMHGWNFVYWSLQTKSKILCTGGRGHLWFRPWFLPDLAHRHSNADFFVSSTLWHKLQWNMNKHKAFSHRKIHENMLFAKWWPFCLSMMVWYIFSLPHTASM